MTLTPLEIYILLTSSSHDVVFFTWSLHALIIPLLPSIHNQYELTLGV
jgi:hypothetical protein